MITFQNVTIAYGANPLIQGIDLCWYAKQVIGLVGKNGSGKTSLLSAIIHQNTVSEGEIALKSSAQLAYLEQEVEVDDNISAHDYVLAANASLYAIFQRLAHAEAVSDYEAMMECHTHLAECDGYRAEAQIAKLLRGLGFTPEQLHEPVASFSGGWRMRLNMARCLFVTSDILLLDEPTNHLDFESVLWLQQTIKHYQGLVVIVSHDRDFLDATVTDIAHVSDRHLKTYGGNYSQFEQERALAIAVQNAAHRKQQAKLQHMMSYVERFRYKASKAKQAQSRLKSIERMQLVMPYHQDSPFSFEFQAPDSMPDPMLTLDKVDLGYGNTRVLKRLSLSIRAGDRIGLLGVNGAGKSTLIKSLCAELKPMAGRLNCFSGVTIGYFAQHQVDDLPLDTTALSFMQEVAGKASVREVTQFLAGFAFDRDQSLQSIATFSGGEKARLALAAIVWRRPGLLLLDEPTNHLDMEMREALMRALQAYQGSVILVTHDRYLLRTLVDELYLIEGGHMQRFEGRVEDYAPVG